MKKLLNNWVISTVLAFILLVTLGVALNWRSIPAWLDEHFPTRKVLVIVYPNSYQYVRKWHSIRIDDVIDSSVFSEYGLVYLRSTEYGNVYLNTKTGQAFYLLDDGRIQSWYTGLRPIIDGKWADGEGSCTTVNGLWMWRGNYPASSTRRQFCAIDGGRMDLAEVDFRDGVELYLSHGAYPDYWWYSIQTPDGKFH